MKSGKGIIIGKRQILLALLIAALGVAVYLNWYFAKTNKSYDVSQVMASSTLGQAVFTGAQAESQPTENTQSGQTENDFFTSARSDRAAAREEQLSSLKDIADDPSVDSSAAAAANDRIILLTKFTEAESNIETLVKAKGFADCAAVVSEESVSVTVRCEGGLLASDTAQIQDIAVSATGFSAENVKIIEIK